MINPSRPQSFLTLDMFVSTFTKSNLNFHHKLNQPRTSSTISNISKKYSYVLYFVFRRKHWRNLPGLICIYVFPACVLSWGCIDKYRRGINNFSLKFLSICICGFELMTSPCDLYQFINPGCALGLPQALLPCWWWSSEIPSLIHKFEISLQQPQNTSFKLKIFLQ